MKPHIVYSARERKWACYSPWEPSGQLCGCVGVGFSPSAAYFDWALFVFSVLVRTKEY